MPAARPIAATYEQFHMPTAGVWWWYVKDRDGEIIDRWDRDCTLEDVGGQPTQVGSRAFRTEREGLEFFASEYPTAVDFHVYTDPDLVDLTDTLSGGDPADTTEDR